MKSKILNLFILMNSLVFSLNSYGQTYDSLSVKKKKEFTKIADQLFELSQTKQQVQDYLDEIIKGDFVNSANTEYVNTVLFSLQMNKIKGDIFYNLKKHFTLKELKKVKKQLQKSFVKKVIRHSRNYASTIHTQMQSLKYFSPGTFKTKKFRKYRQIADILKNENVYYSLYINTFKPIVVYGNLKKQEAKRAPVEYLKKYFKQFSFRKVAANYYALGFKHFDSYKLSELNEMFRLLNNKVLRKYFHHRNGPIYWRSSKSAEFLKNRLMASKKEN